MNPIRTAVAAAALVAVGACGGASGGSSVGGGVVATEPEPTASSLRVADVAGITDDDRDGSPHIAVPAVTTTTSTDDLVAEPSTTTTTVETVDLAPVFDALAALNGLVGQLDAEVGSIDLEDEGVNP